MLVLISIHVASTLFMVGLIWFVQVVHYPLFADVGPSHFETYERHHQRLTTWVVGPVMLVEEITAAVLLTTQPGIAAGLQWVGLVLLLLIWACTAGLSVPAHRELECGFRLDAWRRLVTTNWIRTAAWTLRGGIVLVLLQKVLTGANS